MIFNNIVGVSKGFEKTLIIEGIGYKAEIKGNELVLHVGYSHPVSVQIPENLNVSVEKNVIKVSGISKQEVGDFAAKIKKVRKTNPYSGKGIKYTGEYVIRKSGKKLAGK
ncbi:MAG: 50S ribosomal protein L6 [Candidatus Pacebacteria bacterium]|nr:50S ribosomal protein L6 [Candidatus Paceibacterota bacterium]